MEAGVRAIEKERQSPDSAGASRVTVFLQQAVSLFVAHEDAEDKGPLEAGELSFDCAATCSNTIVLTILQDTEVLQRIMMLETAPCVRFLWCTVSPATHGRHMLPHGSQ